MIAGLERHDRRLELTLRDAARRNALGMAMFDRLDALLEEARATVADDATIAALLLLGEGPAFCAGFDLGAAAADPALLPAFIDRLAAVVGALRTIPVPVVAAVQGAALAGGCALVAACDLVVVAPDALLGYPVHRIGVSPAVSSPTLLPLLGAGAARSLLLGGELIDGRRAAALGLATRCAASSERVAEDARAIAEELAAKGPGALRATRSWLNELDGSCRCGSVRGATEASRRAAADPEAATMLSAFWAQRAR